MTLSAIALGLLVGMQHALDADHVAAVSSLVSRRAGLRNVVRHGIVWGAGHTVTLVLVAGSAILFRLNLDAGFAAMLEFAVGIMLIILGCQVLYFLWTDGVQARARSKIAIGLCLHSHGQCVDTEPFNPCYHHHRHVYRLPLRTFLVGLMHGMAGSAALVVITAATVDQPRWGIVYTLSFGFGSMIGMAVFSFALAIPLTYTARTWARTNMIFRLVIGSATVIIGLSTLEEQWFYW